MFALNEKGCAKRPCSDFGGAIGLETAHVS